jgi:hypothetical protein
MRSCMYINVAQPTFLESYIYTVNQLKKTPHTYQLSF